MAFFNLIRDEKTHYLVPQAITVPAPQFAVISLLLLLITSFGNLNFERSVAYIQSF